MTAAVLYENLADSGTVTASSWVPNAPPSLLQNRHVSRRWKGDNAASEYILVTWPTAQSIDTIALLGLMAIDADQNELPMTSAATRRVRVSSTDLTGVAGDLYDSGVAAGYINEKYSSTITILPSTVLARAVRIDLSQSGSEALLAGRLVIGARQSFSLNFNYNWSSGYYDLSRKRKSAGGLTFVDLDDKIRVLNISFEALLPADRYGFVDEIDRLNGVSSDVLFIIDPDSTDINRDCVWGLLQDMSPPSQLNVAYFSKVFQLEERR